MLVSAGAKEFGQAGPTAKQRSWPRYRIAGGQWLQGQVVVWVAHCREMSQHHSFSQRSWAYIDLVDVEGA